MTSLYTGVVLTFRAIVFLAAVILSAGVTLADGKVFRWGVAELPAIPDQQAIIVWDAAAKTETLVIETRFDAAPAKSPLPDGSSPYAWVVPIPGPAAPQITAATTGLFPTVRQIFQPRVIDHRSADSLFLTIPVTILLLGGVWLTTVRKEHPLLVLAAGVVALFCFTAVLLPSLGSARSAVGAAGSGVEVLERSIVGSYEIVVIGATESGGVPSDSGKAIGAWLKDNGFAIPTGAQPVLADYATRKWVFAAVKLRPDAASGNAAHLTPHPLVFKFKTDQAVYPMRLTGVGNGPLSLDLYVFGPQRAQVADMTEVRCDACRFGKDYESTYRWNVGGQIAVVHPLLKEIVGKAPVATKLTATLTPAQQGADMTILWTEFRESGGVKHSPRSAVYEAIDLGAAVVPLVVVVLIIIGALRRKGGTWVFRQIGWAIAPALLTGVVAWAVTPTVPVRAGGLREAVRPSSHGRELWEAIDPELQRRFAGKAEGPTVEEVERIAVAAASDLKLNVRLEDSPFNYRVAAGNTPGEVDVLLYNTYGAPTPMSVWPPTPRRP